jgi:hypothetical protein
VHIFFFWLECVGTCQKPADYVRGYLRIACSGLHGSFCCECDLYLGLKAWCMSIALNPFHLTAFLRCWIFPLRLSESHMAMACWMSLERTAQFCDGCMCGFSVDCIS